jgi:RNA polymerase sigma-70 factor (ECF subfamily)
MEEVAIRKAYLSSERRGPRPLRRASLRHVGRPPRVREPLPLTTSRRSQWPCKLAGGAQVDAGNMLLVGEIHARIRAGHAAGPVDAAIIPRRCAATDDFRSIADSMHDVCANVRSGARERMDATPDSGLTVPGRMDAPDPDDARYARFEQTVMPHLSAAYNLARWLLRDDHDAEDIVQEAYLRAYKSFASLRGLDARPWLLAIVRNACFTWQHQRRHRGTLSFDETLHDTEDEAMGPAAALQAASEAERIRQAMNELPPEFREAIVLRAVEGLSYKEIANVAGVPVGTVMSRLARARERLEHCLSENVNREPENELP